MSKQGDPDGFGEWAFGDEWWDFILHNDSRLLMQAWNELHGDELLLHPDGEVENDLKKMIALFKLTKNKPKRKNAKLSKVKKGIENDNRRKSPKKPSKSDKHDRVGANKNTNKPTKTRRKSNG